MAISARRWGPLAVDAVDAVEPDEITADDMRRAGHVGVDVLVADLVDKPDAAAHRVSVSGRGAGPLLELRGTTELSETEIADLAARLDRRDAASRVGPWTRSFLELLGEQPHVRAPDLAASIGWDTAPFKANVRKLEALGLSISHRPGYELSPRGRAYLDPGTPDGRTSD